MGLGGVRVMRGSHKLRGAGAFVLEELSQVWSREGLQGGRAEGTGPRDPPGEEGWAQALPVLLPPLPASCHPSVSHSVQHSPPCTVSSEVSLPNPAALTRPPVYGGPGQAHRPTTKDPGGPSTQRLLPSPIRTGAEIPT